MGTAAQVRPPPGNTAEWYTRRKDFLPLHEEFSFTLDACAATREAAKVPRFFCPPGVDPQSVGAVAADGLAQSWEGEVVWCNPGPYDARTLARWAAKCVAEASRARAIVFAVPAWPDRPWWQDHVKPAVEAGQAEQRFPRGRWRFGWPGQPDGLPGCGGKFPQALVIWRPKQAQARPAGEDDRAQLQAELLRERETRLRVERARHRAERARIRAEGELVGFKAGMGVQLRAISSRGERRPEANG